MSDAYWPRGNTYARDRVATEHGMFRVTHVLVYEREITARVCFWRGEYYTREGFNSGERGFTRADLQEGETLRRVT